jgi:hypothetical protein
VIQTRVRREQTGMATWTARTKIDAAPEQLLAVLTDPEAAFRWSPLPFDLEQLDCERLHPGCSARVAGELAGRRVSFDVEVIEAAGGRFRLRATGPVELDVEYRTEPADERYEMVAEISVQGRGGLRGRLVSTAADAAVAGMLPLAVERVAREAGGALRSLPVAA